MQSNFVFLQNDFPVLYQIGIISEKYLYTDSNACLIKLEMFGETVVNLILQLDKISAPQTGIWEFRMTYNICKTTYRKGQHEYRFLLQW